MSGAKRNFIIGISLIIVCILLLGCLPNKQGGFSCVCAPLVNKLKIQLPTLNIPGQNTATVQAKPKDYKVEEAKINKVVAQLCLALKAKDVDAALKYVQAEKRDEYQKIFSESPDVLPQIAAGLEKAKINFLSFESIAQNRIAEYYIEADGQKFSIVFINIDGQWMLKSL
ncbi:MAG: hypothetical protein NTZ34_01045 [Chloroflexi bacterium]|nr:hypothetical protein [Chloroflexota bacterium]